MYVRTCFNKSSHLFPIFFGVLEKKWGVVLRLWHSTVFFSDSFCYLCTYMVLLWVSQFFEILAVEMSASLLNLMELNGLVVLEAPKTKKKEKHFKSLAAITLSRNNDPVTQRKEFTNFVVSFI